MGTSAENILRTTKSDEVRRLVELIGPKRNNLEVDPNDPIFLMVKMLEDAGSDMQKRTVAEVEKLVTGLADQIAAGAVMAENSAKAMSEKIIIQGTEWATKKIREAGEAAAADVRAAGEKAKADAAVGTPWLKAAILVAVVCSASALAAAVGTILSIYYG